MLPRPRTILLLTLAAALVVFAIVQDRVTAAGARDYVTQQRAALDGAVPPVTIDGVMQPAVRRSVRLGASWAAVVMAIGLVGAAAVRTRQ
jgi:hypothetical protein